MNIYEILSSSPNNIHHLNRYFNFIEGCRNANENLDKSIYTEGHHICPASVFPEYKDLKKFNWNRVKLTARQHIVAHLILRRVYGKSQERALFSMISGTNCSGRKEEIIRGRYRTKYWAKLREEHSTWRKGKATYIDSEGNKFFLETSDPLINELSLVGNNKGMTHSEESKQRMISTKERVHLYRGLEILYLLTRDEDVIQQKLSEGFSFEKDEEIFLQQRKENKIKKNEHQSEVMKGLCQHYFPDGRHYGMLYRDDPIIKELNLIPFKEENRQIAIANCYRNHKDPEVQEKKSKSMSKKKWFYDPETLINYRLEESEVTSNLIHGKYVDQETKVKKITINNGIQNKMIVPTELSSYLSSGWVQGMKPQKKRVYN